MSKNFSWRIWVAAILSAALAAVLGGVVTEKAMAQAGAPAAELADCSSVFVVGRTMTLDMFGITCRTPNGTRHVSLWPVKCSDGRYLYGNEHIWGYLGKPMQASAVGGTPGLGAAINACRR